MKITAKGETDIGLTRSTNQDALLVDDERLLYIVADGMGGHAGGEIASQICIDEASDWIYKNVTDEGLQNVARDRLCARVCALVAEAVNKASTKIFERALEEPQLMGMGTTASAMMIYGDHAYVGHVGDSRVYLIRDRFIYQLTNDHSLVGEQLRAGVITGEEAKNNQMQNIITRSVGYQEVEDVDTFPLALEAGDLFVICSDGLHGRVEDEEISLIVNKKKLNAVKDLVKLANDRGGKDNITLIVVHIGN